MFELSIVPLVVARATAADIAELRELVATHTAVPAGGADDVAMSEAFHVRVAACTHNAAIEMLVHSFHGPLLLRPETAAPWTSEPAADEHRDFVEAVAGRDAARAGQIMRAHLDRTAPASGGRMSSPKE